MSPIALICRITVCLVVVMFASPSAAAPVEATATGELRLVLPDGPFKQWRTISFDIEPVVEGRGKDAATWVDVELMITAPSGGRLAIPTFLATTAASDGRLRCRFTPREAGKFTAEVKRAGGIQGQSVGFQVEPSPDGRGFLRVDRNRPYFLLFDNGEQFRGIGSNLGWEPRRRRREEHTYDTMFPRISAHGLNTVRTWICPWNMPVEWNSPRLGEYDPNALKRLDEMLSLAEENGIYVVLVLGYHGELQTESGAFPGNDRWKENPYNVVNGGPCETPADFFTNDEAKALYKQRLRLLVARIACHPHLLAWEFWNEIDHIERRGPVPGEAIVAWHQEMTDYLRQIDPYDHPITTSISVNAPDGLWEIDDLDLIMLHPYGRTDKFPTLLSTTTDRYRKPTIAGEFSYSWKPAKKSEEKDFKRELRLGLWRGLMSPTPVLPMTWWWEYHDSRSDWKYYQPVAKCSSKMTALNNSDWAPIELDIGGDSVEGHGIRVGSRMFLWLYNRSETTASNVRILVRDVPSGEYTATTLSTITGEVVHKESVLRNSDGGAIAVTVPLLQGHQDTFVQLE